MYIGPIHAQPPKRICSTTIKVDKVIFLKRRVNIQSIQGTSWDIFFAVF